MKDIEKYTNKTTQEPERRRTKKKIVENAYLTTI